MYMYVQGILMYSHGNPLQIFFAIYKNWFEKYNELSIHKDMEIAPEFWMK